MSLLLPIIFLLAATLIFVPLAKRYMGTTVLGYLITGLVLGTHVSGLIADPQLIQSLLNLGMMAVMLFLGLSFRPVQLWLERKTILKSTGLQLAVTIPLLAGAAFLLFHQLQSSLILGFALALSAVTLVQQLLQNKQQLHNPLGQACLATLQFQIFITVILIALFPLLEDTASTRHGIAYFAAIIATISGLFLASCYLVRPAFRFLAQKNSIQLIPVLSALIIVSVILIMDILNIHVLIGAFLAGLLLAETEFKAEVERILEPFKDAAIGLFFLAMGLGLSLEPLIQTPLLILGSIFGLILIKSGVIAAIHYYQQRHARLSILFAITLAQSGELSFILLKLAESENLLGKALLQPTLLIVFGSMLLTPLLYWLFDTEILPRLQKKVLVAPEDVPQHPILIVGFGRFGQVVARALHAQGKHFSVIDSNQPDADFIEQYGHRFFDADVTQVENLRAAGIEYCKLLILAIDDVEDSMNLARYLRLNHPDLTLFVRARDRHHAHLLNALGIQYIWRETYAASLEMAQQALLETGLSNLDAQTQIERFKQQDELLLIQQHWVQEQQEVIEHYPSAIAELEYLFENTKTLQTDRTRSDQNTQSDANSLNETS
ncbi:cation:proton antiporter [Acinetobacter sp. 1000160]|uniref:cation:proton antiporter domain-containing protein n=1 Tax=Acinetobacter sp. 1000160 TaxID=1310800 RepID=UPI000448ABAD|nr:cation:proton antiporter [Acinetobacter sp. 1000160]EXB45875.1 sodium/hydrogen exchanger family protein [Acinetobacter baumannii 146457]EYT18613.1 sodium/hydrogen exchanger family protein [Acinetobacter sp. 1000160]